MQKIILFILVLFVFQANGKKKQPINRPYVVMLSMDAFRWDYPDLFDTPNLDSLAKIGVKAQSLQPCFPSKTFPNHYSMATGLYPDHHGIVMNSFVDKKLGEYRLSRREAVQNGSFYQGEPIWVTAEKQGVRSACYFWPGSEAAIKGTYPSIWKKYEHAKPFAERADSVIAWLQKPAAERPHLIFWYLHEPDGVGHDYGPKGTKTREMVESIDALIGDFCRKINALPNADSINLIFTADHGMGKISPEKSIALEQYVKKEWLTDVKGSNPVYMFQPAAPNFADSIILALDHLENLNCTKKENIPEDLHFGTNERVYDIVCWAKPTWSIYWQKDSYGSGGTHGYNPAWKDMHAVFYATGPAFRKNYVHPTFENTNLYALIAELLKIKPVKTDGDLRKVKGMLKK